METNPAQRKMNNIQTEESHFFKTEEKRWKKKKKVGNAAGSGCGSGSEQNLMELNLVSP